MPDPAFLTLPEVAARWQVSRETVRRFVATNGLHAAKPRNVSCMRGGVPYRTFSPEEDAFIEALRVQGFVCAEIGRWCGKRFGHPRSAATISIRLKMLASRAALADA